MDRDSECNAIAHSEMDSGASFPIRRRKKERGRCDKCAALEYAARGIRINAVCPATIMTPMVEHMMRTGAITDVIEPMRRMGTPDEVAACVVWLSCQEAGFVTGQGIAVDGGYTAQ